MKSRPTQATPDGRRRTRRPASPLDSSGQRTGPAQGKQAFQHGCTPRRPLTTRLRLYAPARPQSLLRHLKERLAQPPELFTSLVFGIAGESVSPSCGDLHERKCLSVPPAATPLLGLGTGGRRARSARTAIVQAMLASVGAHFEDRPAPQVDEFDLAPPRVAPPATLAAQFSASPLDRLNHSAGKSYADCARMWLRRPPSPPDWVAFPDDEQAVIDILDWAQARNVAVIPYGGGSSVCGGVEAAVGTGFAGAVSLDLERLNRVLEVDPVSRAARIQAGALGPELEAQLKPHGLTLRHFPQSFEFSTLGGWIATRAGGHYATQYTHIDDFVESTRLVTPAGVMQTRRPARLRCGSGAGSTGPRLRGHARRAHRSLGASCRCRRDSARRRRRSSTITSRRRLRAGARAIGTQPEQLPAARSARRRYSPASATAARPSWCWPSNRPTIPCRPGWPARWRS